MKKHLLILGASGHGKVVADIAIKMNQWQSIAFLDDNREIKSTIGLSVIGPTSAADNYTDDYDIFVGIGNNATRQKVQGMLEAKGAAIPTLIHPNAVVGLDVNIGVGTVIMAGAVVNCSTRIGKGCIINTGATVDHDSCLGDFVHISPGAHLAGSVTVGGGSWLGIGSIVSNNVNIIGCCKIGAGAVVVRDLTESGTYVGVPVRRLRNGENSDIGQ